MSLRPQHAVAFAPAVVSLLDEGGDGLALAVALEQGVTVRASAAGERRITAALSGESDTYLIGAEAPAPAGWPARVRGVTAELAGEGLPLRGAVLEIDGDPAPAPLEVALCLALLALADSDVVPPWPLARICSRVEVEWAGTAGGLLEPVASLSGREGAALLIDRHSGVIEPLDLGLRGWRLVAFDLAQDRDGRPSEDGDLVALGADALRAGDFAELAAILERSRTEPALEAAVRQVRTAGAAGARGVNGRVIALFDPGTRPPRGARLLAGGAGAQVLER